jgi:uncharacterized Fe-S cluster-containing radical SAM superfamily enzyme
MNLIDLDELYTIAFKKFSKQPNNSNNPITWKEFFEILDELQRKAQLKQDFEDSH